MVFAALPVFCIIQFYKVTLNFQVLAGDMSDNHREACASATKPLINSVESLTAYALSPEFAPVPAKISDEVRKFVRRCSIVIYQPSAHTRKLPNVS